MHPIIGHNKILSFFDSVIANGTLTHAYCFVGPKSVGRKTVAREVAGKLFHVQRDRLETIADFLEVTQERDEKKDKTKKDISIEQIHRLTAFLSQSPMLGGYKVAIIDGAEKMNAASTNALLKTLEEPRGKTILFLISEDEKLLPATILSRCQLMYFQPVQAEALKEGLMAEGVEAETAERFSKESGGIPGRAIEWKEDVEKYEMYIKEKERFQSLRGKPFYAKLQAVEDLFGDKTDHIAAREQLLYLLGIWQMALRDSGEFSQNESLSVYNVIQETKRRLKENIHPRLLVEQILLTIP